eukprot:gene17459-28494_t
MAAPNDDAVIANVPFASPPATPTAVAPTAAAAAGGGGAAAAPPAEVEALANAVATTAIGPSSAAARAADQKPIGDDLVATIVTTNNLSLMEKKSLFVDGVKIDIGVGLEWADLEDEDKVVASGFGVKGCKIDRIAYPQYPLVLKAFLEDMEGKKPYDKPTEIQCLALPRLLAPAAREKTDITFQASTGTGKTGAFVGAVLCNIDTTQDHVQALMLAPTRFVAEMHADITRKIGKHIGGLKVMSHYKCTTATQGGKCTCPPLPGSTQTPHSLPRGQTPDCHVLCGTVGKLFNYTGLSRNPKDKKKPPRMDLSKINFVVVDEADELFNGGLDDDTRRGAAEADLLCVAIRKANPKCRFILASATAPDATRDFYAKRFPEAIEIYLEAKLVIPETISLFTKHCPNGEGEKIAWVKEVVENVEKMERMIIFATTQADVTRLTLAIQALPLKASGLHGGMSKDEQDEGIKKFQLQESVVLVSSAIIGRGVDLEGVTHVVLIQPPTTQARTPDYVNFVHKIGRCGRAGAKGTAIVLTETPQDQSNLELIASNYEIEITPLEGLDVEDAAEQLDESREK